MLKNKLVSLLSITMACGITSNNYVNYKDAEQATDEINLESPECLQSEGSFSLKLASAANDSCALAGCHGETQTIGSDFFGSGDNVRNRGIFFLYDEDSGGTKLFGKLSGEAAAHGGGNLSNIMPQESVANWAELESICRSSE